MQYEQLLQSLCSEAAEGPKKELVGCLLLSLAAASKQQSPITRYEEAVSARRNIVSQTQHHSNPSTYEPHETKRTIAA